MYKKISFTLLVFGLMTAVLTACSIEEEAGPGGPQVHMAGYNFIQDSIIINKGAILTLVNDVAAVFTLVFDGLILTISVPACFDKEQFCDRFKLMQLDTLL
jgi:hypothetical protein